MTVSRRTRQSTITVSRTQEVQHFLYGLALVHQVLAVYQTAASLVAEHPLWSMVDEHQLGAPLLLELLPGTALVVWTPAARQPGSLPQDHRLLMVVLAA